MYLNEFPSSLNEFDRSDNLEQSIDKKTLIHSFRPKNYYQFSIILSSKIKQYNSNKDNLILNEIKGFLRFRHNYIEDHDFVSSEESWYLLNFRKYVRDLHLSLNNLIDKHPIDYAVEKIIEKIRMGCEFYEIKNNTKIDNLIFVGETPNQINFYQTQFKLLIIVCKDGKNLNISNVNDKIIIIFTSQNAVYLENINNCTNIFQIYVEGEGNNFVCLPVNNPFQSAAHFFFKFTKEIFGSKFNLHQTDLNEISSLQEIFHQANTQYFPRLLDNDLFSKIKELRGRIERLNNILQSYAHKNFYDLNNSFYSLKISYGTLRFYVDLDKKINFSLNRIKKNNALYMKANASGEAKDLIFSEENFSSALGVNLECLFYENKYASVDCETRVGKGRSDIEIRINKKTISFIENKVIKFNDNPDDKIITGIDQLFARYSENFSINGDPSLRLYLILFSYDKNISDIENGIINSIKVYSERNNFSFTLHETKENSMRFSYVRKTFHFDNKIRFIDIISCNLELDAIKKMKDRIKRTNYIN